MLTPENKQVIDNINNSYKIKYNIFKYNIGMLVICLFLSIIGVYFTNIDFLILTSLVWILTIPHSRKRLTTLTEAYSKIFTDLGFRKGNNKWILIENEQITLPRVMPM